MGVLVATGVGNLGAMAPVVPASATRWGTVLTAKLLGVFLLLALSVVRTVLVRRARDGDSSGVLRASYGATTVLLLVILALAEVLAHGA
jgi:putative copper export protein